MSETREPANAAMQQALPGLVGISPHSTTLRAGSSRAEETRSFSQKNSHCEFFCEKG
jgi:hypothetical protein